MTLSFLQRAITALVHRSWAESMEAESREWTARCPCGHAISIWDLGGIRWKAKGERKMLKKCEQCGGRRIHTIARQQE